MKAESLFKQALRCDPKHALAANNLGVAQLKQSRLGDATRSFQRAVELDGDNTEALNNLALVLVDAGQPKSAATVILRSLKAEPNNPDALYQLTRIYAADSQRVKEEKVWQTLLVSLAEATPAKQLEMTTHCLDRGYFDLGERSLEAILRREPEWNAAKLQKGRLLLARGDADGAESVIQSILADNPDDPGAKDALLLPAHQHA